MDRTEPTTTIGITLGHDDHVQWQMLHLPGYPDWMAKGAIRADDGRLVELTIQPIHRDKPIEGGITANMLRAIKLGDIEAELRFHLRKMDETRYPPGDGHIGRDTLAQVVAELGENQRPGRRGRDQLHYARIAKAYVDALDSGSRSPIDVLTEQLVTSGPSSTRNMVAKARAEGMLTSAGQGKAGGRLTPKAEALLREADDGER